MFLVWCATAIAWDGYSTSRFYDPDEVTLPFLTAVTETVVYLEGGTGVIITAGGYILTNQHVAETVGGHGIAWRHRDGHAQPEALEVFLIATNPDVDLALYRADTDHPLPHITFRDTELAVGEPVMMISHPMQQTQQVSFGYITAGLRRVGGIPSVKYSTRTNWGSSGAPVVDAQGRLVAIHRAWFWNREDDTTGSAGVPVHYFRDLPWIAQDDLD
ncbi:MAG: S1-C subfamily serine protease [Myxococcota bacterium]|jgi:S1-C subfamily serine protease